MSLNLSPIVPRAKWAVRAPARTVLPTRPATAVIVHHAVSAIEGSTIDVDNDGLPDSFEQLLREIEAFHMDGRGWRGGIAYSMVVGHKAGRKAEGRGWGLQSGATGNPDDTFSLSICAIGNYDTVHDVTDELIRNIAEIIAEGIDLGHLMPLDKLRIYGHQEKPFATACPGRRLQARLGEIRPLVAQILAGESPDPNGADVTPEFVRDGWRRFNRQDAQAVEFVRSSLALLGYAPGANGANIDRAIVAFKQKTRGLGDADASVRAPFWRALIAAVAEIPRVEPAVVEVRDANLVAERDALAAKVLRAGVDLERALNGLRG